MVPEVPSYQGVQKEEVQEEPSFLGVQGVVREVPSYLGVQEEPSYLEARVELLEALEALLLPLGPEKENFWG